MSCNHKDNEKNIDGGSVKL